MSGEPAKLAARQTGSSAVLREKRSVGMADLTGR